MFSAVGTSCRRRARPRSACGGNPWRTDAPRYARSRRGSSGAHDAGRSPGSTVAPPRRPPAGSRGRGRSGWRTCRRPSRFCGLADRVPGWRGRAPPGSCRQRVKRDHAGLSTASRGSRPRSGRLRPAWSRMRVEQTRRAAPHRAAATGSPGPGSPAWAGCFSKKSVSLVQVLVVEARHHLAVDARGPIDPGADRSRDDPGSRSVRLGDGPPVAVQAIVGLIRCAPATRGELRR